MPRIRERRDYYVERAEHSGAPPALRPVGRCGSIAQRAEVRNDNRGRGLSARPKSVKLQGYSAAALTPA